MRNLILFTLSLLFSMSLSAQLFYIKEIKNPSERNNVKIAATAEGGFIVLNEFPGDSIFFQLIKYDTCGQLVWHHSYSDSSLQTLEGLRIVVDQRNVIYVGGVGTTRDNTGSPELVIMEIWEDQSKHVAARFKISNKTLTKVNQLYINLSGDILVTTEEKDTSGARFSGLYKMDNTANILYKKSFGGMAVKHIVQVESSNILAAGMTADSLAVITKFAPGGNILWSKVIPQKYEFVSNPFYAFNSYYLVGHRNDLMDTSGLPYSRRLLQFDTDGNLIHTGERFTGQGGGSLFGNINSLIYYQYDSIPTEGINKLSFTLFNEIGTIQAQFSYDDLDDSLHYSFDLPPISTLKSSSQEGNVHYVITNRASVNDTTFVQYIAKSASPEFFYGLGCNSVAYINKDTIIPSAPPIDSVLPVTEPVLTPMALDTLAILAIETADTTRCEISPQSGEEESFHCSGEEVHAFDGIQGKIITVTHDTTVINRQFMFCGSLITLKTKYIFNSPDPALLVPKAFSPNGDNLNDKFGVVADTSVLSNLSFSNFRMDVYNRWGEKVFESDDILQRWDGSYKGKAVPTGVYLYIILYEGKMNGVCEFAATRKGDVTLIR